MSKKTYISPVTELIIVPDMMMLTGASDGNGSVNNFNPQETIGYEEVEDGDFARSVSLWDSDWDESHDAF
ncbi:MAG: hypothetical protein IKC86_06330 [Prevotella sp.]|nr:hypothetical protein [Prevotella sp.]